MPATYPRESEYAKEARKHEAQHTDFGPPGRPYVKRDFPMTVHRAARRDDVTPDIVETKIVESETEMTNARERGFYPTPTKALAAFHALDLEIATLAAEREDEKRRKLSPRAVAEVNAHEEATSGHLATVPETPIRPRTTIKAASAAAGA